MPATSKAECVTNNDAANEFVDFENRKPWKAAKS
jgi:hypothetical protein